MRIEMTAEDMDLIVAAIKEATYDAVEETVERVMGDAVAREVKVELVPAIRDAVAALGGGKGVIPMLVDAFKLVIKEQAGGAR